MTRSKYLITLHYSVNQNDLNIFRMDEFFVTPTHEVESQRQKDEQQKTMKYLGRFMRRPKSDGYIVVQEIKTDGLDCNGVEKYVYPNNRRFVVKNGAVMIHDWWAEGEKYFSGDAYSPDRAIEELRQTIEIILKE